jgi:hypothetical protein
LVALLSLACAFACGGDDTHGDDAPAGAAGQVGGGGSANGGTGGVAGSAGQPGGAGNGGSAGSGGSSNEPASCRAPTDPFDWPEPASVSVPADASWKGDLAIPNDEFFSAPQGDFQEAVRWVKFIVLASDPGKVYFQDALTEPFHYEFATSVIPAFQGMTREQFDAVTLNDEGRQAILGALLVPADTVSHPEYGVQLVSLDDLHPELVETVLATIQAHVTADLGMSRYYFPSGVSAECIDGKAADLAARGIAVGGVDRWLTGDACYAPGWAVGKLVSLPSAEVDAAYLDGRLTPEDILVLADTAPAELPFVAGILTLEPSTPNAHSAILARSYGVPFAYVHDADAIAAVQALAGKRVVLSTTAANGRDPFDLYFGDCDLRFIDVDALPNEQVAEIRALGAPPAVSVAPKRASGALTLPADGLVPADIDRVGGKASHFGVLRAAAPERTPSPALALTFDVWDAFLNGPAPGAPERSLREEIASRLAPHAWPADLRALDGTLTGIRALIEDATFPAALRSDIALALGGFDPARRIRFRSSTNVEDSETFTGAGLYDSATGCLADDLDADDLGPSQCNPDELNERGVFRAIQKVYASFYFRNAYFERARRGVNEATVGMGVLVHYSVPDPEELANGVATLSVDSVSRIAELVTQAGAVSVTNPDGTALPEEVSVARYEGSEDSVSTAKTSSLLPLGAHVLTFEDDYKALMTLFNQVADEYAELTGKTPPFSLDFEYKKISPGELSLRQVRPLPALDASGDVTPFFVGNPETLCVYGSERADAFAAHRLKARIALEGDTVRLTPEQLAQRLYRSARVDYVSGAATSTLEGDPASFTGAAHALESEGDQVTVLDAWTAAGATWTLRTRLTANVPRSENPVRTPDDFFFDVAATWVTPVPFLEFDLEGGGLVATTRTEESVELWGYCPEDITVSADFPHLQTSFTGPGGLRIESSYFYPPPPRGATAGYTAPAIKWEQTTITGLTTTPIVLRGYFSQTYAPNHHNFGGQFIFDPRLEPGLSAQTRSELVAADVAYLVVVDRDGEPDEIWALGVSGALRKL